MTKMMLLLLQNLQNTSFQSSISFRYSTLTVVLVVAVQPQKTQKIAGRLASQITRGYLEDGSVVVVNEIINLEILIPLLCMYTNSHCQIVVARDLHTTALFTFKFLSDYKTGRKHMPFLLLPNKNAFLNKSSSRKSSRKNFCKGYPTAKV